jgi:hypothetical protein
VASLRDILQTGGYAAAVLATADAANLYARGGRYAGRFQAQLTFPKDLLRLGSAATDSDEAPYMSMRFSAYRRRSINEQPFYESQMQIRLPIPDGLVEQTNVTYNKESLGSVTGSLVEAASQGIPTNLTEVGTQLGTATVGAGAQAIQNLATQAPGALNAISALSGIAANPFQTMLFKSPEFRSHTFRWKFAPEDVSETNELRDIINTFKYHSLPGISAASGVFFSYPEILEINFRPSDEFLYRFKPCVVESINVNFTPGSSPSFFSGTKAPTAVNIELRVQEIEIWTKADYLRETSGRFNNPVLNFR